MSEAKTGQKKDGRVPLISGGATLAAMAGRKGRKGAGRHRGLKSRQLPCGHWIQMPSYQRPTTGTCPTCGAAYEMT